MAKTIRDTLSKSLIGQPINKIYAESYPEPQREQDSYPGLEVVLAHKLSPYGMTIKIINEKENSYIKYEYDSDKKYRFSYTYLDLDFTINTDDDQIAAKLYPFFNEDQKTRILAMTLGSKAGDDNGR